MARADLLVELIKNASNGNQVAFRKNVEALIQEEKAKGHRILADRLVKSLQPAQSFPSGNGFSTKANGIGTQHKDLVFEMTPERTLDSLILPDKIEAQIREVVEEQYRAELLHAHNLRARNRLLFAGPPGNGKTTLAEALAFELMVPLIIIRYETLIGSYLGETSGRLRHVLDHARTQRCILFFDEFETLGKERGDTHETGEIKRVVSSLLMQIDALPDYVVVVAASNHPELLDRAVWRRFQVRVELTHPSSQQLCQLIERIAKRNTIDFGYTPQSLAEKLTGFNFSEAEEFCLDVVRRAVLELKSDNAKSITRLKLEQWKDKLKPTSANQ